MKKIFAFILCTLFLAPLSIFAQLNGTIERSIYFETTESSLNSESQNALSELNTLLKTHEFYKIHLQGSTDAAGSDAQHQVLTAKRIETIRAYLVTNGIATTAFTDEKPSSDKTETDGNQKIRQGSNRRIDILVAYTHVVSRVVDRLFEKLESPLQVYQITGQQDTTLVGEKGTIVHVPADAFDVPAGTSVTLRMRESMSMSDFLLDNLSTASEDKILFSGGMLYLDAQVKGKNVGLKGKLTVSMPTKERLPEMEYFTGSRDAHDKQVNWKSATNRGINSLPFPKLVAPTNRRYEFEAFLKRVRADSCRDLVVAYDQEQPMRKITPPVRYAETPSFWERIRLFFGGTPKAQPAKEEPRYVAQKPIKAYRILDSLPTNCEEMARFAIANNMGAASWEAIHLKYREKWYKQAKAQNYASLIANLEFEINLQQKQYEKKLIAFERQKEIRRKSMERAIQNRLLAGNATIEDMNAYVFQTNVLGWINCDAFYNVPPERMIVMATNEAAMDNADVKLVFKNRKSILPPKVVNGQLVFSNIPKGEEAVLVAFKMENGQPYLAMQDVVTSSAVQNLVYQRTTIEALRQKVKSLDAIQ